ncbi:3-deoxy-7-phosphoheptulonate synthase [Ranunculus cassubicifolius]
MALANASSISTQSFLLSKPLSPSSTSLHITKPKSTTIKTLVAAMNMDPIEPWTPDSWTSKKVYHQLPEYPDQEDLHSVLENLSAFPPLVFAPESRALERKLAEAAVGKAFLLQGGDCVESFKELSANKTRDTLRVLLQMAVVLMCGAQVPVIKVGRIAGQFAKPREDLFEERDGVRLPSYRGDIINGEDFTEKDRIPDPERLTKAYVHSAMILNLLRGFSNGGYARLDRVSEWNLDFMKGEQRNNYENLIKKIDEALGFYQAMSGYNSNDPVVCDANVWTSHDCLHLSYETALTHEDSRSFGKYYDCSGHMVWVGEQTSQLDGAHVEFVRGISNPLGIKVGDKMDPSELVRLVYVLNPKNKPGRITIIVRMGAEKVRFKLPNLIRAIGEAGQIVTWVCDPMHGNTIKTSFGQKTRPFDSIIEEIQAFFEVHEQEGSYPGGIHLEMTGENVTECVGGSNVVSFNDPNSRYHTYFDPRLNASQSLEIAFLVSDLLRKRRIR